MNNLKYAVHAYAWTSSWSNKTLWLIDHAKKLGFDVIEIPLMEIDLIDPDKIKTPVLQITGKGCNRNPSNPRLSVFYQK